MEKTEAGNGRAKSGIITPALLFVFTLSALLLQSSTFSPQPVFAAFTDLGAGARATGMGNAFVAVADDVYAFYYNPAGLSLLSQPELAAAYTKHMTGLSDDSDLSTSFVGYAQPLKRGLWGTTALTWQQFDLNGGLYRDQALYVSYGNRLLRDLGPGSLYAGVSAKLLRRAFGITPEAGNAMDGLLATGQADPVLSGKRGISAFDADAGFLYRMHEQYSAGLSFFHITQPNVAFSRDKSDKLPLGIKLGVNRRSLLSNVGFQYETRRSPRGEPDHRLTIGLERWFPWLLVGNIGARGALTAGSREFKQLSAGLSYKNSKISVDYSFSLPFSALASEAGSHRVSFSIRFGPSQEPEESVTMLLEAMRTLKRGYIQEPGLKPIQTALLEKYTASKASLETHEGMKVDQLLVKAAAAIEKEKYQETIGLSGEIIKQDPNNLEAWKNLRRSYFAVNDYQNWIAAWEKTYELETDPTLWAQANLRLKTLSGKSAQQPKPAAIPAAAELPGASSTEIRRLLTLADAAIGKGSYPEAIELSRKVIKQSPDNLSAWENLGISYFAVGDFPKLVEAWKKTHPLALEKNTERWEALNRYLNMLRRSSTSQPKAAAVQTAPARPAPQKDLQRLYNLGIDYYTSGKLDKAKAAFEKLLQLDPENEPAAMALKRVNEERGND